MGDHSLAVRYDRGERSPLVAVRRRGAGPTELPEGLPHRRRWRPLLSTEDPRFAADARPVVIDLSDADAPLTFARPGAVVLEG